MELDLPTRLCENLASRRRHHGSFSWWVFRFEIIHHLLHGDPLNTFMFIDMLNEPFMH
jgi:hypothetical protein